MKINKLKINNYGKLKDKEINFEPNLNIIYGKNEAGKSTLLNFIINSFYGISKNKKGKEISDTEKYTPWVGEEFSGKLEYQLDNNETFEIFRDFKKKNPKIFNQNKEDISKQFNIDKNKGNEFFYEQTKIDEELFLSTIVVNQQEVKLGKQEQNILIQKLANLVGTGDDNVSYKRAIDRINRRQLDEIGTSRSREKPINIIEKEKPEGVILQFGGQTAIKLAKFLDEKNIPILGTDFADIDAAEDREKFDELLEKLNINRPKGIAVWSTEEGVKHASEIGYPVLVRPSYVLGGQGMEITYNEAKLKAYLDSAFERDSKNPVLIDKYLVGREIEVDAICDKEDILIPGIMEHLERAGVHSGDSITMYPSQNISDDIKAKILDYTKRISLELNVLGMVNIQFIEFKGELYIIEVNPRASRTVPYISKVSGVPIVDLATKCMLGAKLKDLGYGTGIYKTPELIAVKVPVFSMSKLARVDVSLGPEMKSTGEVLGVGETLEEALYKGFTAAGKKMSNDRGVVLATVNDQDKEEFLEIAKDMKRVGYTFMATEGTASLLRSNGIDSIVVNKIGEVRPNILDVITNNQVDMVINTPTKGNDATRDGFRIRRLATEYSIDVMTSLDTLKALVKVNQKHINKDQLKVYNLAE